MDKPSSSPDVVFQERQVRVFISSTFRDMQEERDYLIKHVFPDLRRRCQERQVEFVEVDLRWGVTEEQAERRLNFQLAEDRQRTLADLVIENNSTQESLEALALLVERKLTPSSFCTFFSFFIFNLFVFLFLFK